MRNSPTNNNLIGWLTISCGARGVAAVVFSGLLQKCTTSAYQTPATQIVTSSGSALLHQTPFFLYDCDFNLILLDNQNIYITSWSMAAAILRVEQSYIEVGTVNHLLQRSSVLQVQRFSQSISNHDLDLSIKSLKNNIGYRQTHLAVNDSHDERIDTLD